MRFLLATLLLTGIPAFAAAPDLAPLKKWLARQDEFRSVAADFTQTRALKTLRDPVATPGRLWFVAPSSFRWELGSPAKTVVIRKGDTFLTAQPAKKKAERYSTDAVNKQFGGRGMAMMSFPIARDFADFQRQYEVLQISSEERRTHVEFAPRDLQTRKMLTTMKIDFDTSTGHMQAMEMVFRDGSSMRSEFSNVRVNTKVDRDIFDYDLDGYDVKDAKD